MTKPTRCLGFIVTKHASDRFARRFKGHDLKEALERADVVSIRRAEKIAGTVLSMYRKRMPFFLYCRQIGALFLLEEDNRDSGDMVIITVMRSRKQ